MIKEGFGLIEVIKENLYNPFNLLQKGLNIMYKMLIH